MKNKDVAHQFFYDFNGRFKRRSMTVSYEKNKYWSYSTVIAKITQTITGKTICIISDNNFSVTTSKHISKLIHACPFDIYYLPQKYGYQDFNPCDVVDNCIYNLDYYSKQKLSQKPNRKSFSKYFLMLQTTLEIEGFENYFEKTEKALNEYRELFNDINDPAKLAKIKAIQKQREKEKQQRLKEELKQHIERFDISELAYLAYSNQTVVDTDLRTKLRQYLNHKNDLSFIWFDNDLVRTSQDITVNRKEVEVLLKLWKKGQLKHGMTISYYTVLEVMENYVKVGCHKIPVSNLDALLNQMNKKAVA